MVVKNSCNEAKFKKNSFTKLFKFGLFPALNFTMKKCTTSTHLRDSDYIVVDLSNNICSLIMRDVLSEIWWSLISVAARNLQRERRRRWQRVTPLGGCRLVTSNSKFYNFCLSATRLIVRVWWMCERIFDKMTNRGDFSERIYDAGACMSHD